MSQDIPYKEQQLAAPIQPDQPHIGYSVSSTHVVCNVVGCSPPKTFAC